LTSCPLYSPLSVAYDIPSCFSEVRVVGMRDKPRQFPILTRLVSKSAAHAI
jgi:hypothetical protein